MKGLFPGAGRPWEPYTPFGRHPKDGRKRKGAGRIHFVGIGGVGMSGIARVLLNLGCEVSGSDLKPTELTRRLEAAGARVFRGHAAAHARGARVVVVSSAVAADNPELRAARAAGIPVIPRAEMLAELARLKRTVTVSGTHGKTTTTAMTALAMAAAGADPTMVVGGQLAEIRSNARLGLGDYLVAEADESDGSFLRLRPLVAVVTNIDSDHLDHYGGMPALRAAFLEHLRSVPFYGAAVICADDPELRRLAPRIERTVITYGLGAGAHWRGRVRPGADGRPSRVEVLHRGRRAVEFSLRVPGRHNASNALAAVAVCGFLGLDLGKAVKALAEFGGVGRRLELLGEAGGVTFLDDYGHHPTEVRATLAAVRERWPGRRLLVVFQPHRYSRTRALCREFGGAFGRADKIWVAEIYPAGEKPIRGVSSRLILDALSRRRAAAEPFTRAVDLVRELRPGDIVLSLGAGDVWKIGTDLFRRWSGATFGTV